MELDEESNSGFPVALSAPGQANVTEEGGHGPLAASLEARMGANMSMYALGLATTHGDSAVRVFSPHCSPCLWQAQKYMHSGRTIPLSEHLALK